VEEIAHAVDEDPSGLTPSKGKIELVWVQRHPESRAVPRIPHGLKTACKTLGVAMLAAGADLRTSGDGIPRGVSPFDRRVITHDEEGITTEVLTARYSPRGLAIG
jgi:hypothetical protein